MLTLTTARSIRSMAFVAALLALGSFVSAAAASSLFDMGDRYFESFGELEAISADIVMGIRQDAAGFIWLATQGGLIRFDGYEFLPYVFDENDPHSISGNYVQAIHLTERRMWIGTYSDGVSIYDPQMDAFERLQHDPADPSSLVGNDVRAITGNEQHILIASRAGVSLFSRADQRMEPLGRVAGCADLLAKGKLTALALDDTLALIGSSNGVCRIDLREQSLSTPELRGEQIAALADKNTFNIDILRDGEAWISTTDQGLAVLTFDANEVRWIEVDEEAPNKLDHPWVDETRLVEGEVWAATAGGGIAVIDANTLEVKTHIAHQPTNTSGLSLNDVSAILVDDAGLVWIGTWGGGMNRFNPANRAFKALKQNPFGASALANSDIRSAKEMHNGDVWLGGPSKGIQVVRPGAGLVRTFEPTPGVPGTLQNGYIHAFEQLANGDIWVATNQTGLYRFNQSSDQFTQFTEEQGLTDNAVRALFLQDESTLWVGTDAGLTRMDVRHDVLTPVTLDGQPSNTFDKVVETIQAYNGDLWVGTNSGLFVVPAGTTHLVAVQSDPAHPLSDNFIADLLVDSKNRLWLATSQGLDLLDSWDGQVARFSSVNDKLGLPQGALGEALEEDGLGRIWAQANLIDPADWSYTRVPRSAGWDVGNQWIGSNAQLSDGTLLFGGTRGLLMVNPALYEQRQYAPTLAITRSQVGTRHVPMARMDPLELAPASRGFFVEFAALDYSGSADYRYEYKLDGYDGDWVATDARNRRASYSRLAPGDYTLRIRATDNSGNSSANAIALRVRQLPSWYETAWFLGMVLIASVLTLYRLYKWRVNTLKRQKQALDKLVGERTENIRQLAEAGQDITASLDLNRVLDSVYEHTGRFVDNSVFTIGLLSEGSQRIESTLRYQDGERVEDLQPSLADSGSMATWCINNETLINIDSVATVASDSRLLDPTWLSEHVQSLVYCPLLVDENVVGLLNLQSYEKAAYDENALEMLKTIASYAAVAIHNARAHMKLNSAKAEIERISLTDQLTGLRNRRFLDGLMPSEISRLRRLVREGSPERLGALLIDIDHFKALNDSYGHDAGDAVLVQMAERLQSTCRDMDWAVRIGGEEFLIVARITSETQLMGLAERLRRAIESHEFKVHDGQTLHKTCSIGMCLFPFVASDFDCMSWEQTLSVADRALYRAKREGRDRWVAIFARDVQHPQNVYEDILGRLDDLLRTRQIAQINSSATGAEPP
ncbi:MAG: diguanylate cyclase [Pseudomonadota bacterium]